MKRAAARILQLLVALFGLAALVFLLWEPHLEGRNVHSTVFQVYFNDPFLAFVYVGSIAFFVAIYKAFNELGHVGKHGVYSPTAGSSLRTIRYCALAVIGFVAIGEVFIFMQESDDRAGGVVMGLLVAFGSIAAALTAMMLEWTVRRA